MFLLDCMYGKASQPSHTRSYFINEHWKQNYNDNTSRHKSRSSTSWGNLYPKKDESKYTNTFRIPSDQADIKKKCSGRRALNKLYLLTLEAMSQSYIKQIRSSALYSFHVVPSLSLPSFHYFLLSSSLHPSPPLAGKTIIHYRILNNKVRIKYLVLYFPLSFFLKTLLQPVRKNSLLSLT